MTEKITKKATPATQQPDTLAVLSIVFGVVSLIGPGLLLGVPAIITGGIALKKNLPGRGLSIAGLITGSISTVLSLLLIALLVLFISWGVNNPDFFEDDELYYPHYEQQQAPTQHQGAHT